jgi:replication factor C large subunit
LSEDLLWVEKYRPKRIVDVLGNEETKAAFLNWLRSTRRTKKAVLLYGPPGVGKTTLINAAAAEFGLRVIEMNASDARNEKAINAVAGPATSFVALDTFSTDIKGSVLFLDEVDGIAGNEDRGGVSAIIKIIENSLVPVILAANDPDIDKLRPLRKVASPMRFQQVRIPLIITLLRKICQKEGIKAEFEALEQIAQNSKGDVRSAINDLQMLAERTKTLTLQDTAGLTYRNRDIGMEETLKGYFSTKSLEDVSTLLFRSSVDYDELLMAVGDNMPLRYTDPNELAAAYEFVSQADVIRGKIGAENWQLLKYFYNALSRAAAVNPKSAAPFKFITPPIRVITLFWTKGKRTTLDGICRKIGQRCHVSRKTAKEEFVPFIKTLMVRQKAAEIVSWLDLEPEETDFLVNMNRF